LIVNVERSMDITNIEVKFITSIDQVCCDDWNSIVDTSYPFVQHQFLYALESSGSVCQVTGWQPNHLLVYQDDLLIAVMPLYIKSHSYGEYVFDFQWANAYHQSGFEYYPKLLSAIPFTPCSGVRLAIKSSCPSNIQSIIIEKIIDYAQGLGLSSWHLLFPKNKISLQKNALGFIQRLGMQYHWFNKNYHSFDDFLECCKMKRRKNIKRERKLVKDSGVKLQIVEGVDIDKNLWQRFFYFYQRTYVKRSGNAGYLNQEFFEKAGETMASNIMMVVAKSLIPESLTPESDEASSEEIIAIALFFKDDNNLYGRYWGADSEYDFLHFETCYYQGIEYCIEKKLQHFDAGAQGEHKIQRGFEPIETYSYHWINDQRFGEAIRNFVVEEAEYVKQGINQLKKKLPFK